MIGFSLVPRTAIASGVFVEQEAVKGSLGALVIPQKIALFGQYNAGKSPTNYVPRLLASADEAASLYARCGDGESLSACCAALRHYSPQHPLEERIAFTRRILLDVPSSGEPHPSVAVQGALIRYLEEDVEGFEALLDRIPAPLLRPASTTTPSSSWSTRARPSPRPTSS